MPTVNISEHTERPEFIDFLKQRLGVQFRVHQELVMNGVKADIVIFRADAIDYQASAIHWDSNDAIIAVIETKVITEKSLEQHEAQLTKYIQVFKCEIGFVTNYADLIRYSYSTAFDVKESETFHSDQMDAVAEYIAKAIQKSTKISTQKSPEEIIKILERSVDDLMKYTSRVAGATWENILRFSDELEREVKESELSDNEKAERDTFFQRSAAYIAITQLLFYNVFRMYRINQGININPKLRPLSTSNGIPTQIQEIISDVPNNNLNFKAIFGKNKDVYSQLDDDAANTLSGIIQTLEGIDAPFVIGNDLIGQIFQRLMPFETRKKFAAFYTLHNAADLLCKLAIKDKEATIFDPACGSGTLLVYAYRRKKDLGLTQHKKLLEQIRGSDISDLATMMSTVNLAIQDPSKWTNEVNIYPVDAFYLTTGITQYFAHARETPDGRVVVPSAFAPNKQQKRVDVLLANPPFTKGARLSESTKTVLKQLNLVQEHKLKITFPSLGLFAFFLLIAPELVKDKVGNGVIAYILPKSAINNKTMIPIWNVLFKENFGLRTLIEASDADESFSDSEEQEIMVVLERNYTGPARLVKIIGELGEKKVDELLVEIESGESPYEKKPNSFVRVISQKELQSKTCTEWRANPSKGVILFYNKFLPLNVKKLAKDRQGENEKDLAGLIQTISENASRPVDYWFIPNEFWEVESSDGDRIVLRATSKNTLISSNPDISQTLTLPMKALVPAMTNSLKNLQDYRQSSPPALVTIIS